MSYPEEFSYEAGRNEEIAADRARDSGMRIYPEVEKLKREYISTFLEELENIQAEEENQALEYFIEDLEEKFATAYKSFIDRLGV